MKIGFVGLGIMGHPMALNLIRGGHELFVYGRRRLPPDVHEAGAIVCDTLKAIAETGLADKIFPQTWPFTSDQCCRARLSPITPMLHSA